MQTKERKDEIKEYLERRLKSIRERLHENINKLTEASDLAYALEWSEDLFSRAAEERVIKLMLQGLEPRTYEEWLDYFQQEAQRLAMRVPSSSSACSNLIENYIRAYMNEYIHDIAVGWKA